MGTIMYTWLTNHQNVWTYPGHLTGHKAQNQILRVHLNIVWSRKLFTWHAGRNIRKIMNKKLIFFQLIVINSIFEQPSVKNVLAKCKKLVKFFNKSPKCTQTFHKCQRDLGMKELEFVKANKTRWSSHYNMANRLIAVSCETNAM